MLTIGLTGGIGSGKTTVAKIFETLGISIYYSDYWAKNLTNNNLEIISKLKTEFGEQIYKHKKLDKKLLSDIIFNDKKKLEKVNNIIHPIIKNHFDNWTKEQSIKNVKYIIKEAAILFESGAYKQVDKIIVVNSKQKLRIKRLQKRDKLSVEEIKKKMASQMPEQEKIKLADFIIYNNENDMLLPQVLKLHEIFV